MSESENLHDKVLTNNTVTESELEQNFQDKINKNKENEKAAVDQYVVNGLNEGAVNITSDSNISLYNEYKNISLNASHGMLELKGLDMEIKAELIFSILGGDIWVISEYIELAPKIHLNLHSPDRNSLIQLINSAISIKAGGQASVDISSENSTNIHANDNLNLSSDNNVVVKTGTDGEFTYNGSEVATVNDISVSFKVPVNYSAFSVPILDSNLNLTFGETEAGFSLRLTSSTTVTNIKVNTTITTEGVVSGTYTGGTVSPSSPLIVNNTFISAIPNQKHNLIIIINETTYVVDLFHISTTFAAGKMRKI